MDREGPKDVVYIGGLQIGVFDNWQWGEWVRVGCVEKTPSIPIDTMGMAT